MGWGRYQQREGHPHHPHTPHQLTQLSVDKNTWNWTSISLLLQVQVWTVNESDEQEADRNISVFY